MKGKIKLVVGLLFATAVATQAALFVENFDGYDPATDTTTGGLGQGQLEDVTGSTWSGADTDSGTLQTLVTGTAGDRSLRIRSASGATPQLNSSTFTAQDQASAFGFYYNLEKWGTDNAGTACHKWGRLEIGVRDSVSGNNVFGLEMLANSQNNADNNLRVWLFDYTSGTRTNGGASERTASTVKGSDVGSIGLSYDGAGNILITVFAGADQTGASLQTITTTVDSANFSADSMFIRQGAGGTGRLQDVEVDDLTVIPEPATLGLIAVMAGALLFVRRRIMM